MASTCSSVPFAIPVEQVSEGEFAAFEAAIQAAELASASRHTGTGSSSSAAAGRGDTVKTGTCVEENAVRSSAAEAAQPPRKRKVPTSLQGGKAAIASASTTSTTQPLLTGPNGLQQPCSCQQASAEQPVQAGTKTDSTASDPTAAPASKRRAPTSFTESVSETASLPRLTWPQGKAIYVYTPLEVDYHCTQLLASGVKAAGFDIEWRVTYETGKVPRKTALIQLCFEQPGNSNCCCCLLLHIAHSGLTPALKTLLTSQDLAKVGVGISGDAQKLMRDFGQESGGLVDLSDAANERLVGEGSSCLPQRWSLAGLVERLLKARLDKPNQLRCSNWEARPLSPDQQEYAALDAFASLRVYQVLQAMPILTQPCALPTSNAILEAGDTECCSVPAVAALKPLQPAKQAVYKMFVEQGMSAQQVAQARHVQPDTVEGYLADAISAGYAYPWHRMGVSQAALVDIARGTIALLERAAPADSADGMPVCESGQAVASAAQQHAVGPVAALDDRTTQRGAATCVFAASCAPALSGSGPPIMPVLHPCLSYTVRKDLDHASVDHAGGAPASASASPAASGAGDLPGQQPCLPAAQPSAPASEELPSDVPGASVLLHGVVDDDFMGALQQRGMSMRVVKEALPSSLSYGQIRLAFAHICRLRLLPGLLAS